MGALDSHAEGLAALGGLVVDVEVPVEADRLVVLADLVRLGHVGVEVVLAGKDRPRNQSASLSEDSLDF